MSFQVRPAMPGEEEELQSSFDRRMPWTKPAGYFRACMTAHERGDLVLLVAERGGHYLGHVKVAWLSDYPYFRERAVPEIQDLNVLPEERRQGVGSALLAAAEGVARSRSPLVGLGVGVYDDYGPAQRLYVLRGYVPDGQGLWYRNHYVSGGATVIADDDLLLFLIKGVEPESGVSCPAPLS